MNNKKPTTTTATDTQTYIYIHDQNGEKNVYCTNRVLPF